MPWSLRKQRGIALNLILYGIAAAAVLAAIWGAYAYVDHTWETSAGISRGEKAVRAQWDEANRRAKDEADAARDERARLAAAQSARLADAEGRAREADSRWRTARAAAARARVPLVVSECIEPDRGVPAPAGGGLRMATSLRFTAQWLSEWDAAWLDQAGQPVWPDPGIAAAEASQASTIGPEEVLTNHQINAASCSEDRRRYGNLIDLLEKLRAR
ncbi:MAG: hypothetical protein U1A72_08970 [Sulfuritalea sp.]|nr:hypothetical protein [Sulfuritalea sp.]